MKRITITALLFLAACNQPPDSDTKLRGQINGLTKDAFVIGFAVGAEWRKTNTSPDSISAALMQWRDFTNVFQLREDIKP